MSTARADVHMSEFEPPDRRLRNRMILANLLAWILIVASIRFIFF